MNKIRVTVIIIAILFIIFGIFIPILFTDIYIRALVAITWMVLDVLLMIVIAFTLIILD